MNASAPLLNPSEAAKQLSVSAKTLRLYEQRGLITPPRTEAGWRAYGPDDMARAGQIATLRRIGLSLAQVARVLDGDAADLDAALAAQHVALGRQAGDLKSAMEQIRQLRSDLAADKHSTVTDVMRLIEPTRRPAITFDLPWPWGGERYELSDIQPLMYITGPLGSGKTRLARCLADVLPGATFLGTERLDDGHALAQTEQEEDVARVGRVNATLAWLADEGALPSDALRVLVTALETERQGSLVVDMLEHHLDAAAQMAVMAHLRHRATIKHPLFILTRSSAILDLTLIEAGEGIVYCPANHSPPLRVTPYPGTPGYEAVATCVAPPDVRARTEGVVAWRPKAV